MCVHTIVDAFRHIGSAETEEFQYRIYSLLQSAHRRQSICVLEFDPSCN